MPIVQLNSITAACLRLAVTAAISAGVLLGAGSAVSAPPSPVSDVKIRAMVCCAQTQVTTSDGQATFAVQPGSWSVLVLSPVQALAKVYVKGGRMVAAQTAEPNTEIFLNNVDTQLHPSPWISTIVSNGGPPVAGAQVRLVRCCVRDFTTNAAGVAVINGVGPRQWHLEITTTSPTHLDIRGTGVTPTGIDIPMAGSRSVDVTTTLSPRTDIVVTATRYTPPILVRRLPEGELRVLNPPPTKN